MPSMIPFDNYNAPRALWRNNLRSQISAKIWAKIKWYALINALVLVFSKTFYKKRNLLSRLATNCQKVPIHYWFEENFKLLKRLKTIHFLLTEWNFFEFGTSWMVWVFWAHVSKAFFGLYQILLNRWQHNSFLKAGNFLRIGCVSLFWFVEIASKITTKDDCGRKCWKNYNVEKSEKWFEYEPKRVTVFRVWIKTKLDSKF